MTTDLIRAEENPGYSPYQDPAHWLLRHLTLTTPRCLTRDQQAELRKETESGWVADARCASADPEAWFPGPGQTAAPQVGAICADCPVRRSCLASALLHDEEGIWADTTPSERQTVYRWLRDGRTVATVLDHALSDGLPRQRRDRDRMWPDHPRSQQAGSAA